MQYIYKIAQYPAVKKNENMKFAAKRMEQDTLILSEVTHN